MKIYVVVDFPAGPGCFAYEGLDTVAVEHLLANFESPARVVDEADYLTALATAQSSVAAIKAAAMKSAP